jgi:hypothetical protein
MAQELTIFLLDVLENDFRDVHEAMLKGVHTQCEHIFYILGIEKNDMDEVA